MRKKVEVIAFFCEPFNSFNHANLFDLGQAQGLEHHLIGLIEGLLSHDVHGIFGLVWALGLPVA